MGQILYPIRGFNGSWLGPASELYVRGASSWDLVSANKGSAFYKDGSGNWKRFYSGIDIDGVGGIAFTAGSQEGTISVQFVADGTISTFVDPGIGSSEDYWDVAGAPDVNDLQIYADDVSNGAALSGSALNTWLALSGSPSWTLNQSFPGSEYAELEISIRHSPTSTILTTFPGVFEVSYSSG
jgi:hypothetical protein